MNLHSCGFQPLAQGPLVGRKGIASRPRNHVQKSISLVKKYNISKRMGCKRTFNNVFL